MIKRPIVPLILTGLFLVCFFSIKQTSLTYDELSHIPAGYSYLVKQDMRINPEHPPLIKDIAASPLLFLNNINFPDHESWNEGVNEQWVFGNTLLFKSNNPADTMIFLSRTAMIAVLTLGGYIIYRFGRDLFNERVGLISLLLYSLSPTLLAHGRLVTTDVGIAVGVMATIYLYLKFLKSGDKKDLVLSGVALGLTQLIKFTAVFLIPYFLIILVIWGLVKKTLWKNVKNFIVIFLIASVIVYLVYAFHVWNYPQERQISDMETVLIPHFVGGVKDILIKLSHYDILRPITQYLYGLAMVVQRSSWGNTTYFMGEVTASGFEWYFPVLYLLKLPISFHILSLIALVGYIRKRSNLLIELSVLLFVSIYWLLTLSGDLNIGIRHILPIIPLIIILVSRGVDLWLTRDTKTKYVILASLILFQAVSVLSYFPNFIPYYNELTKEGREIAVDSNLDWGQDLTKLKEWAENNEPDRLYVSYFGGADERYYLGDKFESWWGQRDPSEMKRPAYLAVSATLLQEGQATPIKGYDQPTDFYNWLKNEEFIRTIGDSVLLYYID